MGPEGLRVGSGARAARHRRRSGHGRIAALATAALVLAVSRPAALSAALVAALVARARVALVGLVGAGPGLLRRPIRVLIPAAPCPRTRLERVQGLTTARAQVRVALLGPARLRVVAELGVA